MARVISFINYKGGVGKTTTAYHIGCGLALYEPQKRVLLIDADPQTNLTFLCVTFSQWEKRIEEVGSLETLYKAYLDGGEQPLKELIWRSPMYPGAKFHCQLRNIDLVPSDIKLLDIDLLLQSRTPSATTINEVALTHLRQRSILANAIDKIRDQYDYILIDCPPNLYLATQNALYASDGYLVTLMPDHFATIGVNFLHQKVAQLLRERNLSQQIVDPTHDEPTGLEYFLCFVKVPRTGTNTHVVAKEQMHTIRTMERFKDRCLKESTEERKDVPAATLEQLPVFLRDPESQNSVHYRAITQEFREKFPSP